jgi:nitrite reductase (NADH) small subunit
MFEFVTVARLGEIPPGKARQVTVNDRWVGLFNVDGAYYAVDNLCLHRGGPLAEGHTHGCIVTCPWHGWQFNVCSGAFVQDPSVSLTRHDTRVVGDQIQVRLTE